MKITFHIILTVDADEVPWDYLRGDADEYRAQEYLLHRLPDADTDPFFYDAKIVKPLFDADGVRV